MNTKSAYFYIIAAAIFLTFFTNFGLSGLLRNFLFINTNFNNAFSSMEHTFLIEHEWWRLLTPTFLHFSITHLAFNCLWIYILGSKIEAYDGKVVFILIFLITSIASNVGEYIWSGQYFFGGLSGAVYGLLGYCFIIELDSKSSRYDLPDALYLFMFIWLLVGFTGILSIFGFGNIANAAHLIGMIIGFILGLVAKYTLKPY
ncbi:MAG: peptidase, S54 family protein [SAR86 cluster bacterium BACL1 MAG-120920-bin57]|uniref:Peptidase, S54 family protein n=1 Tax=SAR86 cluster bacterium BACL1 MAG-120920-bin57 TaxID=1655571 RepID=A0A0R2PNF0_9GAMM|nr:MAG: peptidase, S54 family protein [SAR86 cluster bacterium BACL1 MAG-120507-bin14]KRO39462.1 MAG: peptidase, S54 family protein [SAR86 cluster bacterium BACL1 MAG-120920-bin57]KRP17918.1 MAG: peptidase, S54 family protein [SAR86 cluster bacterium BACL1 MAG-121022-bin58]KRP22130.1 MAG: peptidase, S54 family protein [SAR86 cluster bacterium BACL1 MAG-121015-bin70]